MVLLKPQQHGARGRATHQPGWEEKGVCLPSRGSPSALLPPWPGRRGFLALQLLSRMLPAQLLALPGSSGALVGSRQTLANLPFHPPGTRHPTATQSPKTTKVKAGAESLLQLQPDSN